MGGVRFAELRSRPREVLECTSVTRDEFPPLGPPFEAAFRARLTAGRLEGKPRTARRVSVDQHGPLPPPDDRLLCILVSLKTSALQVVQGRVCGMLQGNAKPWLHGLLPTLRAALRPRGAAPARSLTARAQRRGVSEADAATVVPPPAEEATPVALTPATAPASPLGPMTGLRDASAAPKRLLNRRKVRAGRQRLPRSTMFCSSMPCSRCSC